MLRDLLSDRPAIEFLDGVAHPKVSPKRTHGRLQFLLARLLDDQGGANGEVVPEWRCKIGSDDAEPTSFVPDVAWVSDSRLALLSDEEAEAPPFSPDVAIEIRSPGDDLAYLSRKIACYLATGSLLVLDVDPLRRAVTAHCADGVIVFGDGEQLKTKPVTWFSFDVATLFKAAQRRGS